ncbi:hypothetical protein LOAG_07656 [Loa loa]|uniref:Uncharacterized protein n=1 Tax=Loa loa TaxID=7209 RepID=A0A1S0TVU4_LOALO|nr:hypothetical protein LOAG_07656 [Loa loa]EFO20832.1 hypothetical protein LOAG_07656 [Loa loa]
MSKDPAVRIEVTERRDKRRNYRIGTSSKTDTDMEYFPENDNSNSKSEYFEIISPTAVTKQPYPQMNFFKNAKISVNDQTTTSIRNDKEKRRNVISKFTANHLSVSEQKTSLALQSLKQFYIRQHSNAIDTFLGFLRENRYVIEDIKGKLVVFLPHPTISAFFVHRNAKVYHVFETSNNICQCNCRTAKYSHLHFTTSTGQEMIKMKKLLTCSSFFGGRCGAYPVCCIFSTNKSHQIIIESPPGFVIGLFT